jgi:hypothetical protein
MIGEKKMKNLIKIFFITIFFIALNKTYLPGQLHSATSDDEFYTIKKGDTLWDISEIFWDDPFKWPELWELNPFITNPHLIYPDETLDMTLRIRKPKAPQIAAAVETSEEVEREEDEARPPKPPTLIFSHNEAKSIFVSQDMTKVAGIILDAEEGQVLMGERDMVYVTLSQARTAHVGDKFTIINDKGEIMHPRTGESIGHKIDILGSLEISQRSDGLYEAIIVHSNKEILKGAQLVDFIEPTKEVVLKKVEDRVEGTILFTAEDKELIGSLETVVIDAGSNDGLEAGNVLYIFREGKEIPDLNSGMTFHTPMRKLGTMVVVETQHNTSTALITMSKSTIFKGDMVKSCSDCTIETAGR